MQSAPFSTHKITIEYFRWRYWHLPQKPLPQVWCSWCLNSIPFVTVTYNHGAGGCLWLLKKKKSNVRYSVQETRI